MLNYAKDEVFTCIKRVKEYQQFKIGNRYSAEFFGTYWWVEAIEDELWILISKAELPKYFQRVNNDRSKTK